MINELIKELQDKEAYAQVALDELEEKCADLQKIIRACQKALEELEK